MDRIINAYQELSFLRKQYKECVDNIYAQYCFLTHEILANQIVSESEIDAVIEGLLDFCEEERFLVLHAELCQHIFENYPNLVGNFTNIFRLQFMERAGETNDEETNEPKHD